MSNPCVVYVIWHGLTVIFFAIEELEEQKEAIEIGMQLKKEEEGKDRQFQLQKSNLDCHLKCTNE